MESFCSGIHDCGAVGNGHHAPSLNYTLAFALQMRKITANLSQFSPRVLGTILLYTKPSAYVPYFSELCSPSSGIICAVLWCRILICEGLYLFKKVTNLEELKGKTGEAVKTVMPERKHHIWHVLDYCLNMLRITRDAHIEMICLHNKSLRSNP
jgi:hypothetical protein